MVNEERTRFGLLYYKDFPPSGGIGLCFNKSSSTYNDNKFLDENEFKTNLFEMIKNSVKYEQIVTGYQKREIECMDRLSTESSKQIGHPFIRSITNSTVTDGTINNHTIQLKCSGHNIVECMILRFVRTGFQ